MNQLQTKVLGGCQMGSMCSDGMSVFITLTKGARAIDKGTAVAETAGAKIQTPQALHMASITQQSSHGSSEARADPLAGKAAKMTRSSATSSL
jgi:hypothetical protein